MVRIEEMSQEIAEVKEVSEPVCRVIADRIPQPYSFIPARRTTATAERLPQPYSFIPAPQTAHAAPSTALQQHPGNQEKKETFMRLRRLHSVLGPGGCLMSDDLYQVKFGMVTEARPFGMKVYEGMVAEFENNYCRLAKKAWHLAHCSKYLGTFKAPGDFSRLNAMQEYNHERDRFEVQYPAMFFVDPRTGLVWMVCLKMVLQLAGSWQVHRTRAGFALPGEEDAAPGRDSDWHMLADN